MKTLIGYITEKNQFIGYFDKLNEQDIRDIIFEKIERLKNDKESLDFFFKKNITDNFLYGKEAHILTSITNFEIENILSKQVEIILAYNNQNQKIDIMFKQKKYSFEVLKEEIENGRLQQLQSIGNIENREHNNTNSSNDNIGELWGLELGNSRGNSQRDKRESYISNGDQNAKLSQTDSQSNRTIFENRFNEHDKKIQEGMELSKDQSDKDYKLTEYSENREKESVIDNSNGIPRKQEEIGQSHSVYTNTRKESIINGINNLLYSNNTRKNIKKLYGEFFRKFGQNSIQLNEQNTREKTSENNKENGFFISENEQTDRENRRGLGGRSGEEELRLSTRHALRNENETRELERNDGKHRNDNEYIGRRSVPTMDKQIFGVGKRSEVSNGEYGFKISNEIKHQSTPNSKEYSRNNSSIPKQLSNSDLFNAEYQHTNNEKLELEEDVDKRTSNSFNNQNIKANRKNNNESRNYDESLQSSLFDNMGIQNSIESKSNKQDKNNGEFDNREFNSAETNRNNENNERLNLFNDERANISENSNITIQGKNDKRDTRGYTNGFRTFEDYQFLKIMNGESYRGDYNFGNGIKERIENNIKAIKLTQDIFKANRLLATNEEKEILSKFSGFGGLKDIFYNEKYEKYNIELKEILDEELYKELRNSADTAFYTPNFIIKNIYDGLSALGVDENQKVKVLEPSCGTGKFISLAPKNYEFEAVEKDIVTATIAKFLHPNVRIYNKGFEEIDFMGKKFDIVVGNPPYEKISIKDVKSLGNNQSIHNYFAIKSAELLRDGGLISFVISSEFLDSYRNKHRITLNELGNFISVFRLPNKTFKESNTEVLTDVFFYQRIENKPNNDIDKDNKPKRILTKQEEYYAKEVSEKILNVVNCFDDRSDNNEIFINNYLKENDQYIFGNITEKRNQYGLCLYVEENNNEDYDYKTEFRNSMLENHKVIFTHQEQLINEKEFIIDYDSLEEQKRKNIYELRIGSIFEINNKIYVKKGIDICTEAYFKDDGLVLNDKEVEIAKKVIEYRDLIEQNIQKEREYDIKDEDEILEEKEKLRKLREEILELSGSKFLNSLQRIKKDKDKKQVIQHGLNKIIDLDIINSFSIYATEIKDEKNDKYEISNFLKERIFTPKEFTLANNPEEALQKTISDKGYIDIDTMQSYLPNIPIEKILWELLEKHLIFHVLDSEKHKYKTNYILADQFLSGNVKAKYKEIEKMIENKIEFENLSLPHKEILNILENNFPKYIKYEDIKISFGANYIDTDIYANFIKNTFFNKPDDIKIDIYYFNGGYYIKDFQIITESYNESIDEIIKIQSPIKDNDLNEKALNLFVYNEKNVLKFDLKELIERTINGHSLEVTHTEPDPLDEKKSIQVTETIPTKIALENAELLKEYFEEYCFNDENTRDRIEKKYNDKINVFSQRKFDFSKYLETPYLNKDIKLREHQKNAIYKGIMKNSLLLEHEVGAGKTFAGISLVMEQVRMGLVKKALILVPNHLTEQWGKEFLLAYPNANVLVEKDVKSEQKKKRKEFLYRAKYGNYNAIIMRHSTFENMSVMETFQTQVLNDHLEELELSLKESKEKGFDEKGNLEKVINSRIKEITRKLLDKAKGKKFDEEIAFEDLGIDALIVDEAHYFKNLPIITTQNDIKGIPTSSSDKAMKMFCATQYCHNNNYKLYFLTGTPVSNSIAEFYIMQKYLQPDVLDECGLFHFDSWQKAFTQISISEELDSSGVNYKLVSRLSKFINTPELISLYRNNVDVVTNEDIEKQTGRFVPKLKSGKPINVISPRSSEIAHYIGVEDEKGNYNKGSIIWRMDNFRNDPRNNNMLKCTSDARKAALDFRLIDPNSQDYEDSKINKLVEKVIYHYNDKTYPLSTQLIFCDLGVSKINSQKIDINAREELKQYNTIGEIVNDLDLVLEEDKKNPSYIKIEIDEEGNEKKIKYTAEMLNDMLGVNFNVYSEILKKLVKNGIPQKEIAFIGDVDGNSEKKQELFNKVNAGEVRILIGSTQKMGAGTNVQKRIIALHDLDCPWRPSDLQQRAGRAIRQGNIFFEQDKENFEIFHYRYATEQTYDSRMFQINEQKLIPLAQLKKANFLDGQREFDSIDAEVANMAEMKAVATGNPFIIEKHKIQTLLKTEERHFELYKKNIIQTDRAVKELKIDKERINKEIDFLKDFIHNNDFEKENYEIEAFGIKTTKKPKNKNDEINHKNNKDLINKKLEYLFNREERIANKDYKILKANDIELIFRGSFDISSSTFSFRGILINENKKEYAPINLFYKTDKFYQNVEAPNIDKLLIRITNTIKKSKAFFLENEKKLKEINEQLILKERFLRNNTLENYNRKFFLDILKKDMRNINEIFTIRNNLRKEGIIVQEDSIEIKDLLPKYSDYLDDKGKLIINSNDNKELLVSNLNTENKKNFSEYKHNDNEANNFKKQLLNSKDDTEKTEIMINIFKNKIDDYSKEQNRLLEIYHDKNFLDLEIEQTKKELEDSALNGEKFYIEYQNKWGYFDLKFIKENNLLNELIMDKLLNKTLSKIKETRNKIKKFFNQYDRLKQINHKLKEENINTLENDYSLIKIGSNYIRKIEYVNKIKESLLKGLDEKEKEISLTYDLRTKNGEEKIKELFYKDNPDNEQIELFEKILPVAKNLGVEVKQAINDENLSKEVDGVYYINLNSARVKHNRVTQLKSKVLLHELIHSVTSRAIIAYEANHKEILDEEQIKAIKNLKKIYEELYNNCENEEFGFKKYKKSDKKIEGDYGLKNLHEFIAELSNPTFREKLKKINLFEKIIDNIVKLFFSKKLDYENKENKKNVYENVKRSFYDIIDNYQSNFTDKYNDLKIKELEIKSEKNEVNNLMKQVEISINEINEMDSMNLKVEKLSQNNEIIISGERVKNVLSGS